MAAASSYALRDHDQPELSGDGLLLRPWRASDTDALLAAFADPAIQRWHRLRLDGDAEARDWVTKANQRWSSGLGATWAVTVDGIVAGQVGLRGMDLFEGQAELSYWTLPAARHSAVATRAGALATRWAFDTAGVHRMILNHSTRNTVSCKVAARLGYPLEGTKRAQLQHADGWHDMHLHARLVSD